MKFPLLSVVGSLLLALSHTSFTWLHLKFQAIHLELSRRRLTIHFRVYSHFRYTSQQNSDSTRK